MRQRLGGLALSLLLAAPCGSGAAALTDDRDRARVLRLLAEMRMSR